jgi:hypothetical protein
MGGIDYFENLMFVKVCEMILEESSLIVRDIDRNKLVIKIYKPERVNK